MIDHPTPQTSGSMRGLLISFPICADFLSPCSVMHDSPDVHEC